MLPPPVVSRIGNQRRDQLKEIHRIAHLLRQKLVPEIVQIIIEQAGHLHHQVSTSDQYQVVRVTNSPATCLCSAPISVKPTTRKSPIQQITFIITAKDQGYIAYPGHGSWTWFTAAIAATGSRLDDLDNEREIFRNITSPGGFQTHTITWSASSEDQGEADWVQKLQHGSVVVVRGHAKYIGWVNFINSVQVVVSQRVVV